jgi:two-component system, cell cycle response regulator
VIHVALQRARGGAALGLARGVAVVGLAAFVAHAATQAGGPSLDFFFNAWVYNGLLLLAAAACLVRVAVERAERGAWLALGIGIAAWTAGDIHYTVAYSGNGTPPFPSLGDAFYLAFYPASYVALLLLLRQRVRRFRHSLWLDGVMAAFAAAALSASVLFEVVLETTEGSKAAVLTNLAYPLGDVILLALVIGVFALTCWRPGSGWALIGVALLAFAVADAAYLFQVASGRYVEGGLLDALWPAALLLLAQAAWRRPQVAPPVLAEGQRMLVAPAICGLIGIGVLTYDHFDRTNLLALTLAVATLLAVIVRTALTFTEKQRLLARVRDQAATDALTGLGNRRRLLADLGDVLAGRPPAPTILLIFDLDGFKRYNDTYGHPAGDALLTRLGRRLRAATEPYGASYRLGGDEFCVLARLHGTQGEVVVSAVTAALRERGEGFEIASSFGAVFLPDDAADAAEALRLADQRLYVQKAEKHWWRGHPHEVLLQALYEREPELHDHVRAVARLSAEVGRRLGLRGKELEDVQRAAELHDVGKLAIPDDVLRRAGPLDESEWEFIRRHTVIGQRILGASPALVEVAKIVRSTHERWNGQGYPDGLRGEEIPLAARIVLACDAFVAMTTDRAYARRLTDDDARAELRRCAGRDFDPRVVEVVCEATVDAAREAERPDALRA